MTRRAAIRTADLNRAVKVAKAHGYAVRIRGDEITLLPMAADARLYSVSDEVAEAEDAWDRALGLL